MPNTHTLISSVTTSAGQNSILFQSIPQTYTDLLIKLSARANSNGAVASNTYIQFNGVNVTNREVFIYGTGTGFATGTSTSNLIADSNGSTATAGIFGNTDVYIFNYASTGSNKAYLTDGATEDNATLAYLESWTSTFQTTSAITSIMLSVDGNFAASSTLSLYGIKNTP